MKQQMTVGEMIAAHHWRDALHRSRKEDQAFAATNIGRALLDFENTQARAWQLDCQDHCSERALNNAWEKAQAARRVLVTHIKRLQEAA